METFSELLSRYIKQAGISDTELARSIGISRQTVFRWREGLTSRPNSRNDILAIAKKLRLSAEETNNLLLSAGFRPEETVIGDVQLPGEQVPVTIGGDEVSYPYAASSGEGDRRKSALLTYTKLLAVPAVLLGLVLLLINWPNLLAGDDSSSQQTTEQPGQVLPAASGEALILVAFPSDEAISVKLADSLTREARSNRLGDFRADVIPEDISDESEARSVLDNYKGALVIWGRSNGGSLSVFLTPAPVQPFSPLIFDENGLSTEQIRTLALLSLVAVSFDRGDGEQSLLFLSAAGVSNVQANPGGNPFQSLLTSLSERVQK